MNSNSDTAAPANACAGDITAKAPNSIDTSLLLLPPSTAPASAEPQNAADKDHDRIQFAERMTFQQVTLNAGKDCIVSIGGCVFAKFTNAMCRHFLRSKGISIPDKQRTKTHLEQMIVAKINGTSYREKVTKKARKKGANTTKPAAVQNDGTLYRIINTVTHESTRQSYIGLFKTLERLEELDSKNKTPACIENLYAFYIDSTNEDLKSAPRRYFDPFFTEHSLANPWKFDDLDLQNFKATIDFVNAHYRQASNRRTTSGNHKEFCAYIEGKTWLLYYFNKLSEIGNTELKNCIDAKLDSDTILCSGNPMTISTSSPGRSTKKSNKCSMRDTSAQAIAEKNLLQKQILEADQSQKKRHDFEVLCDSVHLLSQDLDTARNDLRLAKRTGSTAELKKLRNNKVHLKKKLCRQESEYKKLKKEIGYDSPDVSDTSESGGE